MNKIRRSLIEFQETLEEFDTVIDIPEGLDELIKRKAIEDGRIDLLISTKHISYETFNLLGTGESDIKVTSGRYFLNGIQFFNATDVISYFRTLPEDKREEILEELNTDSSNLLLAIPFVYDIIDKEKTPIAFRFDGIDILEHIAVLCDLVTVENKSTGNIYCTFKKGTEKRDHYKNIYKYHALALYFLDSSITREDLENMFNRCTSSEFRNIMKSLGVSDIAVEKYIEKQAI